MKKIVLFAILGLVIAGFGIGVYVMRPSAEASSPIQALPVQPGQSTSTAATPAASSSGNGETVYQIVPDESKVSFKVDEVLRGNPAKAVGTTNQVAGEVAINFSKATVQLGIIQVDARTLKTDSGMRDRMIKNEILDTNSYEIITFKPKSITGLPQSAKPGDEISVSITGDLTIRDITQEATFTGKVKLVSMDRLEGNASATVHRSDYKILIPNVPSVANVSDNVLLEIQFVAIKK